MYKYSFNRLIVTILSSLVILLPSKLVAQTNPSELIPTIFYLLEGDTASNSPGGPGGSPTQPPADINFDISSGFSHTCKILTDGQVTCWGATPSEIIDEVNTSIRTPIMVPNINSAVEIAAGDFHTCVILEDSTVRCWGVGTEAQLGNGSRSNSSLPVQVISPGSNAGFLQNVVSISSGHRHSCAALSNGRVACWGNNFEGQAAAVTVGDNPRFLTNIQNAVKVVSSTLHNCALLADGRINCWGISSEGLGNGTNTIPGFFSLVDSPVFVENINSAIDISAGSSHICALLLSGEVKCWGGNVSGQLGNGQSGFGPTGSSRPITPSDLENNVRRIFAGSLTTCAIKNNGLVFCLGDNDVGQLGDNNGGSPGDLSLTPVRVLNVANVVNMSSGNNFTCASLESGRVQCWGENGGAQSGNYDTDIEEIPIATFVPHIVP